MTVLPEDTSGCSDIRDQTNNTTTLPTDQFLAQTKLQGNNLLFSSLTIFIESGNYKHI